MPAGSEPPGRSGRSPQEQAAGYHQVGVEQAGVEQAVGGDLLRSLEAGVLWVTLNRPDMGNAMTADMNAQLATWVEEASADLSVRCLVIAGAGEKGFCTGADLRASRAPSPRPSGAPTPAMGEVARVIRIGWQRLIGSLIDCEKPVIAAVNGTAAGGGMHLALACDLVVAAEGSRFIEAFVRRGIAPDAGGAYLLTRLVGLQKAKELLFFGEAISATEAERIGLVNRVVPRDELAQVVKQMAASLAQGPTKAIGAAKWLANRALETDRSTSFWEEAMVQEMVQQSEDAHEGVKSFVERREPRYVGW